MHGNGSYYKGIANCLSTLKLSCCDILIIFEVVYKNRYSTYERLRLKHRCNESKAKNAKREKCINLYRYCPIPLNCIVQNCNGQIMRTKKR